MSFEDDLKDFELKFTDASNEFVQGTEIALFNAVIMDTPVDKGRLVGNWQTSTANPASGVLADTDAGRSATIAKMTSFVESLKGGRVTFLTNNLPYAVPIEFGHSKIKAPQGMVRRNVTRFQAIVKQQAAEHRL